MAIINCPECGKTVSDKAVTCPNCGCPIESTFNKNVKIKLSCLKSPTGFHGNQKASIIFGPKVLWEGRTGDVVELKLDQPITITVKYHISLMHYGGECVGRIDPAKSKRYNVSARQGIMSTKLVLQPVDVFDAD